MTVSVLDRALVAGEAGQVSGERQKRPDPEVPEKARRRTFTAQYKLDVVAEYDAAATGEKGAVLRREGLYSGHVIEWRRTRGGGGAGVRYEVISGRGGVRGQAHGLGRSGCRGDGLVEADHVEPRRQRFRLGRANLGVGVGLSHRDARGYYVLVEDADARSSGP